MKRSFSLMLHVVLAATLAAAGAPVFGQDNDEAPQQDDVSKALDSTATQWSFQFAYQDTSWKDDMVNGQQRQPGHR